jgi:hypothetical protein
MCAFFRTPIHDLVDVLIRHQIVLTDTSMMTGLWSDPPITPRLAIHLFNVTNSEAVLASGAIPIGTFQAIDSSLLQYGNNLIK